MVSLLGCPEEVCRSILGYLSQFDLYSVCLAHSHLHTVAEQFLYSEIELSWKESKQHPITSLLRSIIRRPQLAHRVHSISLVGSSFNKPQYKGKAPKIPISENDLEEPLAFVARTNVSYRQTWAEELRNGTMDAFVAVLISQLLHLFHLSIGPDFFKETRIIGMVLRSKLCEDPSRNVRSGLESLKTTSVTRYLDVDRDAYSRDLADVLPLFYLPFIESISASIDNPVDEFAWPATQPPTCSTLRKLALTDLREGFLGQILSAADKLQSLEWEWSYSPFFNNALHTPIIDLSQITEALNYVQHTLTELRISAVCDWGWDGNLPAVEIRGSLSGLTSGFGRLKKLTVPQTLLLGFSMDPALRIEAALPSSLEFLTLTDDLCLHDEYEWEDQDVFMILQSWLLETLSTATPHLQGLELYLKDTDDNWNLPLRDRLEELCAKVGVQLKITKLRRDLI